MFVDTNVLVHATVLTSPFRDRARKALQHAFLTAQRVYLSRQILREYLAVVTRPRLFAQPVSMLVGLADVQQFEADFAILEDGPEVFAHLDRLCRAIPLAGRQVHDANIVATMLAHGENRLLTANRKDFVRFEPRIQIVEP